MSASEIMLWEVPVPRSVGRAHAECGSESYTSAAVVLPPVAREVRTWYVSNVATTSGYRLAAVATDADSVRIAARELR
jgi:hypothetical protein